MEIPAWINNYRHSDFVHNMLISTDTHAHQRHHAAKYLAVTSSARLGIFWTSENKLSTLYLLFPTYIIINYVI